MELSDNPLVLKDSRVHFLLISYFHPLHAWSPLASESPAVTSGVPRLFIFIASSMVSSTKKSNQRNSSVCHRWSTMCSRTKHGGDCPEHFLLPWRALLCSRHTGGVEVPGRIQNLFFFLTETQILITCLNGRDPGKLSGLLKLVKPSPSIPSSAKDKRGCGDRGLGLQTGGRQFTWRWQSKCLLNKRLLDHAETAGCRLDSDL